MVLLQSPFWWGFLDATQDFRPGRACPKHLNEIPKLKSLLLVGTGVVIPINSLKWLLS